MNNNPTYTDNELFALIAEGDEDAFEKLFDLYLPRIQPVILQIVKSEIVAKDIVQDVFLRLWLNRTKLTDIDQPKNYIFRIVYNQSFKYLQRHLIQEKATSVLKSEQNVTDTAVFMDHALDMAEVYRMIETAILTLPPQSRKIYRLNRIAGYKPREIASHLGISVQSVRNSLTRSGQTIREYLGNHGIVITILLLVIVLQ